MPFDSTRPAANAPIVSAELRDQFNGLKSIIDTAGVPVGCVLAYLNALPGAPPLPAGWAPCNGQVISDPQSPFNGQAVPNLNGFFLNPKRFLRGALASGAVGGADAHSHSLTPLANDPISVNGGGATPVVTANTAANQTTGGEIALPSYYEVVWVIRVK